MPLPCDQISTPHLNFSITNMYTSLFVDVLFGRAWHPRRLVYTTDIIAFTLPSSNSVSDAIPLFEVEEVVTMNEDEGRADESSMSGKLSKKGSVKMLSEEEKLSEAHEKKPGDSNKVKFRNALQIHTKSDGYNSGRQYIIQARSSEESRSIADQLGKLSRAATEIFLAKSRFTKAQVSASSSKCLSLFGAENASDCDARDRCDYRPVRKRTGQFCTTAREAPIRTDMRSMSTLCSAHLALFGWFIPFGCSKLLITLSYPIGARYAPRMWRLLGPRNCALV